MSGWRFWDCQEICLVTRGSAIFFHCHRFSRENSLYCRVCWRLESTAPLKTGRPARKREVSVMVARPPTSTKGSNREFPATSRCCGGAWAQAARTIGARRRRYFILKRSVVSETKGAHRRGQCDAGNRRDRICYKHSHNNKTGEGNKNQGGNHGGSCNFPSPIFQHEHARYREEGTQREPRLGVADERLLGICFPIFPTCPLTHPFPRPGVGGGQSARLNPMLS